MVRSVGLCVCVCGIKNCIKHSKPRGINSAGITMFHTNLNSADADANARWTHHNSSFTNLLEGVGAIGRVIISIKLGGYYLLSLTLGRGIWIRHTLVFSHRC